MVFKAVPGLVPAFPLGLSLFCYSLADLSAFLEYTFFLALESFLALDPFWVVPSALGPILLHISYLRLSITSSEMQFPTLLSKGGPSPVVLKIP